MHFIFCLLFVFSCKKKVSDHQEHNFSSSIPVCVAPVNQKPLLFENNYTGQIKGHKELNLFSMLTDNVHKIDVQTGEYVKEGSLLVELEKTSPSSTYRQALEEYKTSKNQLERQKALFQTGSTSEKVLEEAYADYQVKLDNFRNVEKAIDIRAPFDGQVAIIYIDSGQLVNPNSPLIQILTTDTLDVIFYVAQVEFSTIKLNQTLEVISSINPKVQVEAEVYSINLGTDKNGLFQVKAKFENPFYKKYFQEDSYVRVKVENYTPNGILSVPNQAILISGREKGVYVIKNSTKAIYRKVETGVRNNFFTTVLKGLSASDSIITNGVHQVTNLSKVHVSKFCP